MAEELLNADQRRLLLEQLVQAYATVGELQSWLEEHLPIALRELTQSGLEKELLNLFVWANSSDGMRTFLQALADHSPRGDPTLPATIFALTGGKINRQRTALDGLPQVPPHLNWFAADRPFVNRKELRDHLAALDASPPGSRCILVIDGGDRSGKTFALSLVLACQSPDRRTKIDVDEYARVGAIIDARRLACHLAGDEEGCPPFDPTKEDSAVPDLLHWVGNRLKTKKLWIILDHLNRRTLSDAARLLLRGVADRVRNGELPNVRLVLVDFDRNQLPLEWRDDVRHDQAVLPDRDRIEEWCTQIATVAKRKHSTVQVKQWVGDVFARLEGHSLQDGTWHRELECQLRGAFAKIMKCELAP